MVTIFRRTFLRVLMVLCVFAYFRIEVFAMQSSVLPESAYVTLSPDGMAFTTNAGDKAGTWYAYGTTESTGSESALPKLAIGEHYYRYEREGIVPVLEWQVRHVAGQCIHNHYNDTNHYHGVAYQRNNCLRRHYSGWVPICADCGDEITHALFYMSSSAAASITYLNMGMSYYYLCPYCDNLEQGVGLVSHQCLAVSPNRYFVKYDANGGSGYMPNSVHMYGDAAVYEGAEVSPSRMLSQNAYTRWGYEFVGWTQYADGSGAFYSDGEKIYNLTEKEGEVVTLYAKWRRSESVLYLHTEGGSYEGTSGVIAMPGRFGEARKLDKALVVPPPGYTVCFDAMQGEDVPSLVAEKYISSFRMKPPMLGIWKDDVYTYPAADGSEDHVEICYGVRAIQLPTATREGYAFGGWYYDEACTQVAGSAGTDFTPSKDVRLYAGWTTLYLEAKENPSANDGKGAVDLSWEMESSEGKTYKIYQKKEEGEFFSLGEGIAVGEDVSVEETFRTGEETCSYQVPYTGYYKVKISGAQGEDYEGNLGGKGGSVTATMYLKKGDVLTYTLGTTQGVPGGGRGTLFGNGGGYSALFLEGREGAVLIAGGGGGADILENGGDGGSAESVMEQMHGESGTSGGGGGYHGGCAGILEQHFHDISCKHTHVGNANQYGGCYTVTSACGYTEFTQYVRSNNFYYGNKVWDPEQKKYVSCFCPRCGSYSCSGHRDISYGYRCNRCSTTYTYRPGACSAQSGYQPGCGRDESYVCGFEDGQILRSVPSFGGSSYADMEICLGTVFELGEHTGDGILHIESVRLGFHHEKSLKGVLATDEALPQKIDSATVTFIPEGDREVWVKFERPEDMGTAYYHKVEAYDTRLETYVCTSNLTKNTLRSGVIGYYYCLDECADTKIEGDEDFYENRGSYPKILVPMEKTIRYLHVAAVDKAGNIAEPLHIKLSDKQEVLWPVYTKKLTIEENPGVYAASENEYYVRADGNTMLLLHLEGYMAGLPRENYQINEGILNSLVQEEEGRVVTKVPLLAPVESGVHVYEGERLVTAYEGNTPLSDGAYLMAKRFEEAKNLILTRGIALEQTEHGKKILVYPSVRAAHQWGYVQSDEQRDVENGLWLVADGQGPEITGMEALHELELLDGKEQTEFTFTLRASDADSGLSVFEVQLMNSDNFDQRIWRTEEGELHVTLPLSESVLNGNFSLLARAVDHVGNVSTCGHNMTGYYLYADMERLLSPKDPVFQAGESGKLTITAGGYVDKLVVTFPEELSGRDGRLDREFVYEIPMYEQREEILFMVPLYTKEGEYKVKIQAYKDGTQIEDRPVWLDFTVKGSVLDDFRTRLR